ncbi:Vacuolar protein sorting-associated protein 11-like protein [Bienertia sinuspersici]
MTSKSDSQNVPDMTNPLYLHPSDGPHIGTIGQKLVGSSNYRSWKRDMEIVLASKRKLRFVTELVKRDASNPEKQEMWDTCNNMVIAWLTSSMSPAIKESVVYMRSAKEIWDQFEKRFSMTDGTRKYKLNRDAYDLKQKGKSVNEYYIAMKAIWDELDALDDYPSITTVNAEIRALVDVMNKEEARKKLRGSVEGAKEEEEIETTAMVTSRSEEVCPVCGNKGHGRKKCWKVGWYGNAEKDESVQLTAQQLEQLLKLIPNEGKGEDELETSFAGMVTCCNALCISES